MQKPGGIDGALLWLTGKPESRRWMVYLALAILLAAAVPVGILLIEGQFDAYADSCASRQGEARTTCLDSLVTTRSRVAPAQAAGALALASLSATFFVLAGLRLARNRKNRAHAEDARSRIRLMEGLYAQGAITAPRYEQIAAMLNEVAEGRPPGEGYTRAAVASRVLLLFGIPFALIVTLFVGAVAGLRPLADLAPAVSSWWPAWLLGILLGEVSGALGRKETRAFGAALSAAWAAALAEANRGKSSPPPETPQPPAMPPQAFRWSKR